MLKLEFVVEASIIFVKNIKKGLKWYDRFIGKSVIWTVMMFENSLFLRATKVLKSGFKVEAIITFVKSIKKALSGIFTLYESQLYGLL